MILGDTDNGLCLRCSENKIFKAGLCEKCYSLKKAKLKCMSRKNKAYFKDISKVKYRRFKKKYEHMYGTFERRKKSNICVKCGKPKIKKGVKCLECREAHNSVYRYKYELRKIEKWR